MNQPGIVYFDRISVHPTDEGSTRADRLEAMRELNVPDLRWPSGCTSTGYHWQRGVGPEDERHDDAAASQTCHSVPFRGYPLEDLALPNFPKH